MKRILIAAVATVVLAGLVAPALAQRAQSQVEFGDYWVVIAQRGPKWQPQTSQAGVDVRMEVIENLQKAFAKGEIVNAGVVTDDSGAEFIAIIVSDDEGAMRQKLEAAPHVADGFYRLTIYDWHAPKGLVLQPVPLQK